MSAIDTHTAELTIESRGARYEVTDEATGRDRQGAHTGWIMFIDVQGEQVTADELREIADKMDEAARTSGRKDRHD
jgi:hypothetical protein